MKTALLFGILFLAIVLNFAAASFNVQQVMPPSALDDERIVAAFVGCGDAGVLDDERIVAAFVEIGK